jgi:uncharacterized protein YlaN (UPF0358 family)
MLRVLIVIAIVILFIVLPKSPTRAEVLDPQCYALGQLAEVIMLDRQQGKSPTEVLERYVLPQDTERQDLVRDIVFRAFELPAFANHGSQQTSVQEFRNEIELECYLAEIEETS